MEKLFINMSEKICKTRLKLKYVTQPEQIWRHYAKTLIMMGNIKSAVEKEEF